MEGLCSGYGTSIHAYVVPMSGGYDDLLEWPVNVKINLQLLNQMGGKDECHSQTFILEKPGPTSVKHDFNPIKDGYLGYSGHQKITSFLKDDTDDTLYFFVSEIELLQSCHSYDFISVLVMLLEILLLLMPLYANFLVSRVPDSLAVRRESGQTVY